MSVAPTLLSIKWSLTSLGRCLLYHPPDVSLHYSARRRGYRRHVIICAIRPPLSVFINEASVTSPGLLSQRPNNRFTVIGERGLSGSWKQLLNKHQLKLKKEAAGVFLFSFPLKIISVSCFLWIRITFIFKILAVWTMFMCSCST